MQSTKLTCLQSLLVVYQAAHMLPDMASLVVIGSCCPSFFMLQVQLQFLRLFVYQWTCGLEELRYLVTIEATILYETNWTGLLASSVKAELCCPTTFVTVPSDCCNNLSRCYATAHLVAVLELLDNPNSVLVSVWWVYGPSLWSFQVRLFLAYFFLRKNLN